MKIYIEGKEFDIFNLDYDIRNMIVDVKQLERKQKIERIFNEKT